MARKSDWVYEVRKAATQIRDANFALQNLAAEYSAAGYSGNITAEDLEGANGEISPNDIVSLIGSTVPALQAVMDAGHATNIDKVRLTLD